MTAAPLPRARRQVLQRRIRWIVTATISYNAAEAVIALAAGGAASSSALIGFGLDSVVEVLSAAAIAWQFSAPAPERREKTAMRAVAIAFLALAVVVTADAVRSLLTASAPDHSTVGVVLAVISLLVMPGLSWFERRTGRELGSASAVADSRQTLVCAWLSAVLLAGLAFNSTLGWWWADPVAALIIAAWAVREGIEAWNGDACGTPLAQLVGDEPEPDDGRDRPAGLG